MVFGDFLIQLSSGSSPNETGTLIPDHFDTIDGVFAIVTLFLIVKFVNSLRPILED